MAQEEASSKKQTQTMTLTTPMAIVIAGALIAGAVYLGNTNKVPTPPDTAGSGDVQGAAAENDGERAPTPRPAGVGDFREVTSEDHIRGAENAKVTIIEYSDLECPFCQRFHSTLQQVLEEYPNDVRWVYRHAPLVQLHSKAPAEANAAECAGEQGKFWEFVDLVFETSPGNDGLDLDTLPQLAQDAGVPNIPQFESCVESDKYADHVDNDLQDAQSAGLRGTPYSVAVGPDGQTKAINGAQPFSSVKTTIESMLQ